VTREKLAHDGTLADIVAEAVHAVEDERRHAAKPRGRGTDPYPPHSRQIGIPVPITFPQTFVGSFLVGSTPEP
jgi:hypothetical protein